MAPTGRSSYPRTAHRVCSAEEAIRKLCPRRARCLHSPAHGVFTLPLSGAQRVALSSHHPLFSSRLHPQPHFVHLPSLSVIDTDRSLRGFPSFSFILIQETHHDVSLAIPEGGSSVSLLFLYGTFQFQPGEWQVPGTLGGPTLASLPFPLPALPRHPASPGPHHTGPWLQNAQPFHGVDDTKRTCHLVRFQRNGFIKDSGVSCFLEQARLSPNLT